MKKWNLAALVLLLGGLLAYTLFSTYEEVRRKTIADADAQQLLLARQAAGGIEDLFRRYRSELLFLSRMAHVASLDAYGRQLLDSFWRENREELRGVTRVDADGVIVYTAPRNDRALGTSIRFQEHVAEVLSSRRPVLSDVFTTVQGFRAVAYHVPVWQGQEFAGSLAILVPFDTIARRYLEGIRIVPDGHAWMISAKGVVLYCPEPGHVGRPATEVFDGVPSLLAMTREMTRGRHGTAQYERTCGPGNASAWHAVYYPVDLGNTFWSIAVAAPEDEIVATMEGFRNRWGVLAALLLMLGGAATYALQRAFVAVREGKRLRELAARLEESERYFRMLVELSPLAISVCDRDGRIELVNERFVALLGYTRDDLADMDDWWARAYPDEEFRKEARQRWEAALERLASSEEVVHFSGIRVTCKNGTARHMDVTFSFIGDKGVILLADATERVQGENTRRELEEKLARSRKMEALGMLAGGVAHDLNNILSGIITYPEILLMRLPGDSPFRKPLETIQQSGERAAAVVSDLLTLARGVVSRREHLDLGNLVREYARSPEFMGLQARFPRVRLVLDLEDDLPPVDGSPVHVEKTIMNLVTNAMEAIGSGGTVAVRAFRQEVCDAVPGYEEVPPGTYAVLVVEDDGPGIGPEDLERIFEPFYTKKVMGRSGTGLGLSVVWNTVKDHGGHVQVESSGAGTVFRLYFPATSRRRAEAAGEAPVEAYQGNGERVLVVDDEPAPREIARDLLARLGYRVTTAASGNEAVEALRAGQEVDLVVLDMLMPGMDGHETYEALLRVRPGLRAVVVSGFSKTADVDRCLALGAHAFLKKPYRIQELGLRVRGALDHGWPSTG